VSPEKALLVAANPFKYYQVSPTRVMKELGDVEFHRVHRDRHGGVFWDVIPSGPSRQDLPWKHPEIHSGYFYIAKKKVVKYWMNIEYIKRWKEIDLGAVEQYIPEPRRSYLQSYPETVRYYAILIREISELRTEHKLEDFTLVTTNGKVERLQNYAIVTDPGWRS
jgi:hypothetical protein